MKTIFPEQKSQKNLTNLFDSLEKQSIVSKEVRTMIRTGTKMYYRDFYVVRNKENKEYSSDFEKRAKDNLMFRTLFSMLDGTLNEVNTIDFLNAVYANPELPITM